MNAAFLALYATFFPWPHIHIMWRATLYWGNAEILKAEKLKSGPQDWETTGLLTSDYGPRDH